MRFKQRGAKKPRRKSAGFFHKKKFCRLCKDKLKALDYKDIKRLERFINDRGKILSSRISGNCAKHQRMTSEAIKRARFMSLIPYTKV